MLTLTAGMGMVGPLMPIIAEDLGASGFWLGLAFSGFALSQTPLTPVFGRLSELLWDGTHADPAEVDHLVAFCLGAVRS